MNARLVVVTALSWSSFVVGCAGAQAPTSAPVAPVASAAADGDSITNLYDAFGPEIDGTVLDFGFSALVRYRGKTILFDGGTNADLLERNARALGVDLRTVDFAVVSHSHFDHVSGIDYLLAVNPDVKIYFPSDPFWGAPMPFDATGTDPHAAESLPPDQRYFRGDRTKFTFRSSGRYWKRNVEYVPDHKEIAPGINLIVTRSPYQGYFSRYPNTGIAGEKSSEEIKTLGLPELSLSLSTGQGEVLLVGCSHSLVDVITRTAKAQLSRDIHMVYGGYHLLPYDEGQVAEIARRLKEELGVAKVAPAHCTGHLGFKVFRELYGDAYLAAGLGTRVEIPE